MWLVIQMKRRPIFLLDILSYFLLLVRNEFRLAWEPVFKDDDIGTPPLPMDTNE